MSNEPKLYFKVQNGNRIDIHTKDDEGFELVVCYGVRSDELADRIVNALNTPTR